MTHVDPQGRMGAEGALRQLSALIPRLSYPVHEQTFDPIDVALVTERARRIAILATVAAAATAMPFPSDPELSQSLGALAARLRDLAEEYIDLWRQHDPDRVNAIRSDIQGGADALQLALNGRPESRPALWQAIEDLINARIRLQNALVHLNFDCSRWEWRERSAADRSELSEGVQGPLGELTRIIDGMDGWSAQLEARSCAAGIEAARDEFAREMAGLAPSTATLVRSNATMWAGTMKLEELAVAGLADRSPWVLPFPRRDERPAVWALWSHGLQLQGMENANSFAATLRLAAGVPFESGPADALAAASADVVQLARDAVAESRRRGDPDLEGIDVLSAFEGAALALTTRVRMAEFALQTGSDIQPGASLNAIQYHADGLAIRARRLLEIAGSRDLRQRDVEGQSHGLV